MRHCTWTYVGDAGFTAKVGLLHSTKTGHLIIYINSKISTIDFKVKHTKSYSFFINDELCAIKLERKGDKMYYHFEIDHDADTPRNRARKKIEKKYWKQTVLFFSGFAICILGLYFVLNSFMNKSVEINRAELLTNSVQTIAKVNVDTSQENPKVSYYFIAENNSYSTKSKVILSTGMPLEQGDEFIVDYAPDNPKINQIRFDQPTEKQVVMYQERVFEKHQILNPKQAEPFIKCQIEIALQLKGLEGLADFYFQNIPVEQNEKHNKNTYLRLIRDIPFKKLVEENCWD